MNKDTRALGVNVKSEKFKHKLGTWSAPTPSKLSVDAKCIILSMAHTMLTICSGARELFGFEDSCVRYHHWQI